MNEARNRYSLVLGMLDFVVGIRLEEINAVFLVYARLRAVVW